LSGEALAPVAALPDGPTQPLLIEFGNGRRSQRGHVHTDNGVQLIDLSFKSFPVGHLRLDWRS
jgi:hypothetical protein